MVLRIKSNFQVKIKKPYRNKFLIFFFIFPFLVTPACKKMDHSKFKMPKMPFITAENLHSVVTPGEKAIRIFGDYGIAYSSSDNGKTWEKQDTKTENHLFHACFIDIQRGWACGTLGTILYTSDGGKTWEKQKSGTDKHLFSIHLSDCKNGCAVGDMGTVIVTTDGGNTWVPTMKEEDVGYNDVFFSDLKNGWIVGEFGTILHTTDGGKTWKPQTCKDIEPLVESGDLWSMPKPTLYSVSFKDNKRGWIAGIEGVLLSTEDGGLKWKKIPSDTKFSIFSLQINGEKGWAVGAEGNYLITTDGGKKWNKKDDVIKVRFWLQGLSFRTDRDGFVVGSRGTVVHTTDGGETWKMLSGISYEMPEFKMPEF